MKYLYLPSQIFESNLPRILSDFADVDGEEEPITLDFHLVKYWIPVAVVFACSMVNRWREQGREVFFANVEKCQAFGYFQRMDFFDRVGLRLPENFQRHDSNTSFVEIGEIQPGPVRLRDPLATSLAQCLAGTTDRLNDVLRFSEFALGEIMANCQQHALKPGFAAAQYVAAKDYARVGVADFGIGIRESFRQNGSPHYREGMSDKDALSVAMKPWVSSKTHLPPGPYGQRPNRGIGLKMIKHMVEDSFGELLIASGSAWLHFQAGKEHSAGELSAGRAIPGTVVGIRFDRGNVSNFQAMLRAAQSSVGLTMEDVDMMFGA